MRRRLLSGIVTLLCVMLCAFGLAACGEDSGAETVAVESVTLNKTELTLEIGGEETLTATVTPDNATNKTVVWSSDNPAVVTVADGKVTAVAAGTATITATADGKSATCSVTVDAALSATEVTAEKWAKIMESADNFTYLQTRNGAVSTHKIDGSVRAQIHDGQELIFVKEGNDYFCYVMSDGSWTKNPCPEDFYNSRTNASAELLSYFKDGFASFAYADGKYTAASLDKTETMNGILKNVEVTFEKGALVGIKFSVTYGETTLFVEVTDVGTTTITLPT